MSRPHRRPGWPVALGALVSLVGSVGFVWAFVVDAANWWLGGTLALALAGLGVAFAYWGRDLVADEVVVDRYPLPVDDPEPRNALAESLDENLAVVTRRRFLAVAVGSAAVVFGLSQVVLAGAFGPRPRRALFGTDWRPGSRLVTFDGRPVTRDALAGGGFLVAFPEGATTSAMSQVVLLHLPPGLFAPQPGRETWSPEGFVAYSRVCTHAGCAVAQYEDEAHVLLCPCHQSTFDVLHGAAVVWGPAGRALPQLPLAIDSAGNLFAQRDFDVPVGPGFWDMR